MDFIWVIWTPSLKENLIFKGGTALKKCYFGNYRFSEDLDLTNNQLLWLKAIGAVVAVISTQYQAILNEKL